MDGMQEPSGSILEWDELDVHIWLSRLGLPQYEAQIKGMLFFSSLFRFSLVPSRWELAERGVEETVHSLVFVKCPALDITFFINLPFVDLFVVFSV